MLLNHLHQMQTEHQIKTSLQTEHPITGSKFSIKYLLASPMWFSMWHEMKFQGFDTMSTFIPISAFDLPEGRAPLVGHTSNLSDPKKDKSILSSGSSVKWTECAEMQLSYVLCRVDTEQHVWEICKIPLAKKGVNKIDMLKWTGKLLHLVTAANDDIPPLGTAQHFHASHIFISMAFLGLLSDITLQEALFFRQVTFSCFVSSVVPHMPVRCMYFNKHPMFSCGDAADVQKSIACKLGDGSRIMIIGAYSVFSISGIPGVWKYQRIHTYIIIYI